MFIRKSRFSSAAALYLEYQLTCQGRQVYDRTSAEVVRALRNPYLPAEDQEEIRHCPFCGGLHLIARWIYNLLPIRRAPTPSEEIAWALRQYHAKAALARGKPKCHNRRTTNMVARRFPFFKARPLNPQGHALDFRCILEII